MTGAACWDAAANGLPPEVRQLLNNTGLPSLRDLELLAAFPEWETALPGGERPSCTDVMALARNHDGLAVIAVEIKVNEPFGPTVGEKRAGASRGQEQRFDHLEQVLQLEGHFEDSVRYQLLHRTASALLTARQFHAATAVMLVHSFSPVGRWRDDLDAFAAAMGSERVSEDMYALSRFSNPSLFLAWCTGEPGFQQAGAGV